jgi:hypothetical protein
MGGVSNLAELLFSTVVLNARRKTSRGRIHCKCASGNSIEILIVLFSIAAGKQG